MLAFHPKFPLLAVADKKDLVIRIWETDLQALLGVEPHEGIVHYCNAKIVLLGDSGVGKSGLALVLTGQRFVPTESTHGRHVWTFAIRDVDVGGSRETREVLLWDLAGQAGYRLIHQLYLNEVAVALVLFDARTETDPLAGVRHWDRALSQAAQLRRDGAPTIRKFLVAARSDRGGVALSLARIESFARNLGFAGYFETSAKEGRNIAALAEAINAEIPWQAMPRVSSTQLFQSIKSFLVESKNAGRLLTTEEDLYLSFAATEGAPTETSELRVQFSTCVGRVESRGLIRRLSFGNLILLQPELLDAYASSIVNAAKDEPDGLGSIAEDDARAGRFAMSESERIRDREQEKLLLIATVEDMIRYEIALRERAEGGPYLVFPSQLTRENQNLPDPEGKAVIFSFEGATLNIYATLVVRLSHSGLFARKGMWKNAATYDARVGGVCGISLREVEEGRGELTLFFDAATTEQTRFQFEEYVRVHLERRAVTGTISRRRIFMCDCCRTPITELQTDRRRERGFNWIQCNVCGEKVLLLDREERLTFVPPPAVVEMDTAADSERALQTATSILEGKVATGDFDVFLAHNSQERREVNAIAQKLKERGLYPWLDKEQVPPGRWFQDVIQKAIPRVKSAAIFIGPKGLGRWQSLELRVFVSQCVDAGIPVIPVLLPGVNSVPSDLLFLRELKWVPFLQNTDETDALDNLVWGITGKHP